MVGLVVPGAVLMIGVGALIGIGVAGFWPILFAAVAGAIVGDGLSFWLGHHYRARVRTLWPFRKHPQWLAIGEDYFRRHGGKSIVFGRFVGPVRPFIPVVAGMLGMRSRVFYVTNILSALLWAPAYLLPGMAFGASMALAGEVAARLVVLLLALAALVALVLWTVRWLYGVLSPRAGLIVRKSLEWGGRHPQMNKLIGGLLNASEPELKTLLVLAVLLIATIWLFLGVLEDVVTGDPLVRVDQGFYQLMQNLRTPWGDRVMVFVTELGDGIVLGIVAVAVLAWLLWLRNWRVAGYWAAAVVFGQLAATAIKLILQRQRPLVDIYEGLSAYAFPSGHAVMSTVVYGFLAVLIARRLTRAHRWLAYGLPALLISAIALSRLYLGVHWLSDVIGGLSLGLAWVSLLGIAYYRHSPGASLPASLPVVALLAIGLGGGWHIIDRYAEDLQIYAPRVQLQHRDSAAWWLTDWHGLPVFRQDLEGDFEQPFNLQWSGSLATLRAALVAQGWRDPVPLTASSALRWLLPDPELGELPLLPQVHDGRHESLLLIGPEQKSPMQGEVASDSKRQPVLRLWQSGIVLDPAVDPLWVGSVTFQALRRILFLRLPVTLREYDTPRQMLENMPGGIEQRRVRRIDITERESPLWPGDVLLLREQ